LTRIYFYDTLEARERYTNRKKVKKMAGRTGASILQKFFGKKDGQTLGDFVTELKELSDTEYEQLRDGISNGTLTY
jgi:hypothetical protein